MSDGPHRSLPMRPGWQNVARRGDRAAYAVEDIGHAIIPALEQDCRVDIDPPFLDALCGTFRDQEQSLFRDDVVPQLEALRGMAGLGIGRVALDHAIERAQRGESGVDAAVSAVSDALTDRAARCARQVEEHYCRESTQPRAHNVRDRIERAIGTGAADIEGLARKLLNVDGGSSSAAPKQQGVDDGVRL